MISCSTTPEPPRAFRMLVVTLLPSTAFTTSNLRHCLEHIARFKRPKSYIFEIGLPKNNYGKVLKTELRARLAANAKGE